MRADLPERAARFAEDRMPSDRSFGVVMSAAFLGYALWRFIGDRTLPVAAVAVGAALLALAYTRPAALHPLNRAWTAFGRLLARVVNPAVMAALFVLVFTPVAWIGRRLGRDALRLQTRAGEDTYWIRRDPPGPRPDSLSKQY